MITANVISRVFYLSNPNGGTTGTCFTVDQEGRQYIVTAKHVIETLVTGDNIGLFFDGRWNEFPTTMISHSAAADVSICAIELILGAHPLPATGDGMVYGQDVYFLGFPYGFRTELGAVNGNRPLPVVKKGIASSIPTAIRPFQFLLDGHNNPGFSGGPVVFCPPGTHEFRVAGIISGFYKERNAQGQPIEDTNSGIIQVYGIEEALELIRANPTGPQI